ncbi:ABC transporter substrate-binding protein [Paenibacillus chungangensis]|uniref:ABC transporter substrate-binding protein n=1 Tax=Paenibacillus chungangensis TaxID=696535 RepID=A0ABW3HLA0_9BACL
MKINQWKINQWKMIVGLLTLLAVVGCSNTEGNNKQNKANNSPSGEQEIVKLKVYTNYSDDSEKQPVDYAIAEMKKLMPDVEVEIDIAARDDNQKIKTLAAAGNLPDIFAADYDVIKTFKSSNNLLELDKYVDEWGIEDMYLDSVRPLLRDSIDGKIYAVHMGGNWASLIYYNKEVFERLGIDPPKNYSELLDVVKVLNQEDIIPLALFAKEKWPGVQLFDMIATRKTPTGIMDLDSGAASISDEAYTQAAEKIVELVEAGLLAKGAFNMGYDEALALFTEGEAAMLLNGGWAMEDLGQKMGDEAGILYYPFAEPGEEELVQWNMSGGGSLNGYAVSPYSKNKDIAAKYATMFSVKVAEGKTVKRNAPPLLKDSPQSENGLHAIQQEYVDATENFKSMTIFPWGLKNAKVKTALEDNVQKLLTGSYSVENFIKDTTRSLENAR